MTEDIVDRLKFMLSQLDGDDDDLWNRIYSDREDALEEILRLRNKCDMQANILRKLTPENHPDTLFISGVLGKRDQNNMPEKLLVVPAYGVDLHISMSEQKRQLDRSGDMNDLFEEFIEEVKMLVFWAGPIAGDTYDKEAARMEEENIARVEYLLDKIENVKQTAH